MRVEPSEFNRMKLALIRRQFSATGGAELYLQRLVQALAQRGHEIHVLAEKWAGLPEGVVLHALPVGGIRALRPRRFAEAVQKELNAHVFDCVFSLERTIRQDVYRAGDGLHRVWLERRREFAPAWRRPFIGWGWFHRQMLALEAEVFNPQNTRHIIVNSRMVRDEILQNFDFPAERIHWVPNGVDVRRFQSGNRQAARRRWGIGDGDYVLLFAGSGWERKGLRFLLQAVEILNRRTLPMPLKLVVAGKGRPPKGAPANVIFAGAVPDMENACAAADLFVLTPIYEPSANVCIEALAAGLPVITTRQNGASEWIQDGVNGAVLSSPADIASLADAIMAWMAKGQVRLKEDAGRYDLERNVERTLAILEQAAGERRREATDG